MYQFKRHLFDEYDGFGDKRVKDIAKDYPFKIDDQSKDDKHEHFCGIFVKVIGETTFELHLTNNAPLNSKIQKMIEEKGGDIHKENHSSINVRLSLSDYDYVLRLSKQIQEIVAPGNKYHNTNWKWLCPRTANSLKRFAKILKNYKG